MREAQSDIAYHMPLLEDRAARSAVILELGVGNGNGSTRAFAAGIARSPAKRKLYISVDSDTTRPEERPDLRYWHMVYGSSDSIDTLAAVEQILKGRRVDLLFIDTDHTYERLQAELRVWEPVTCDKTVWLFHDTWMHGQFNSMTNAITEYVAAHPGWEYVDISRYSHGMGELRRKP